MLGINKLRFIMVEFPQYLGFILFLTILTIGFWLLFFLVGFVQYWIGGALWEFYKEKRAKKEEESN
ncbi:hypothetical protein SAMN02745938_10129 [Flavobacterium psychrophilum DSM 3660]|nr:hypothetical protein FPSM_01208 [Flavobacterium psychrophilum]SCX75437.1 hypothetical protein SAMN02745938_10129 [Flavobacterium psychrophilum DSM 3660] [Flavobacterium psychrophilum DSM 3660 = ATCC 49418]SNA31686.1 conserved hypothetical protein [Flavobacterium psychrophilum]SNA64763.1 conserved hypothetical protein [Flavobacterium psychrophilum]SNA64860.1 conserved hypothetical protein [Flavobacterium psychrophilum]